LTRQHWYAGSLLILLSGCSATRGGPELNMEAADPADRIRAIVTAVEGGDSDQRATLAALVDRLEDEDEVVRFYAIAGLHRLTGQRLGFRAHDPVAQRRLAVERWRVYLGSGARGTEDEG
jgi:hypothetical protein